MKLVICLLSFIISTSAFASKTTLQVGVSGWVKVQLSATLTCLSTHCPPSKRYYEVSLVNAQVEGFGPVNSLVLQDLPKRFDLTRAPKYYLYNGVKLQEGQYVTMVADVVLYSYPTGTFGYLMKASEVEVPRIQPRR